MSSGFPPDVWGPSMWFMFLVIAATYPVRPTPDTSRRFQAFYKSLEHVLPCEGCRRGYASLLRSEPTRLTEARLASRNALFKWTVDVHNRVNAKVGKPVQSDWRMWLREYDKLR